MQNGNHDFFFHSQGIKHKKSHQLLFRKRKDRMNESHIFIFIILHFFILYLHYVNAKDSNILSSPQMVLFRRQSDDEKKVDYSKAATYYIRSREKKIKKPEPLADSATEAQKRGYQNRMKTYQKKMEELDKLRWVR